LLVITGDIGLKHPTSKCRQLRPKVTQLLVVPYIFPLFDRRGQRLRNYPKTG
jgi:hypothetical protein